MMPRPILPATILLSLLGLGFTLLPQDWSDALRRTVLDASRPGQRIARGVVSRAAELPLLSLHAVPAANRPEEVEVELRELQERYRHLQIECALVREQMQGIAAAPPVASRRSSEALIVSELVHAEILGEQTAAQWRAGRFLDAGSASGLRESALVLRDERPLIDRGADADLSPEQPVIAGLCVVGRTANVGRWTSTLQLITDPEYRGWAQIVKNTERGPVFAAEGILAGEGRPLCRLLRIRATEAVSVGDDVYTSGREGLRSQPMYYGRIVRAELQAGAAEWSLQVEPALDPTQLRTVQILRLEMNPARLSVGEGLATDAHR